MLYQYLAVVYLNIEQYQYFSASHQYFFTQYQYLARYCANTILHRDNSLHLYIHT